MNTETSFFAFDWTPLETGEFTTFALLERAQVTRDQLALWTNEMIDRMLALIADCVDADVTFVPDDPDAEDTFAENPEEVGLAWTLGHVIAHTTASSEEYAFIGAELARGVKRGAARSRYEVPWETVTTIHQCRERLQESRRIRLATLNVWPQPPHLENTYEPRAGLVHNCISRFVAGLLHDDSHLKQIENIVRQARSARG